MLLLLGSLSPPFAVAAGQGLAQDTLRLWSAVSQSVRKENTKEPGTYTLVELVGVTSESYTEATKNAIARASKTLRGLGWFQVTELRGLLQDGKISEYQVTVKIGFRIESRPHAAGA
jgi:flavin-binding protein dodecin